MAYNHACAFFLIALTLFAAENPVAHGQFTLFRTLIVSGRLCCTPTGICLPRSQPVSGAPVSLNCTNALGDTVSVATTTTGANGQFNFTITNLTGIVPAINPTTIPCVVVVNLPLNSTICPILSRANGALIGIIGGAVPVLTRIIAVVLSFVRVSISI